MEYGTSPSATGHKPGIDLLPVALQSPFCLPAAYVHHLCRYTQLQYTPCHPCHLTKSHLMGTFLKSRGMDILVHNGLNLISVLADN